MRIFIGISALVFLSGPSYSSYMVDSVENLIARTCGVPPDPYTPEARGAVVKVHEALEDAKVGTAEHRLLSAAKEAVLSHPCQVQKLLGAMEAASVSMTHDKAIHVLERYQERIQHMVQSYPGSVPAYKGIVGDIFMEIRKELDTMSPVEAAGFGSILSLGIEDIRFGGFVMTLLEKVAAARRREPNTQHISV